ncbi:MAG: hypothetical protein EOO01_06255 [Chitinophagaceae bacterium]|nr:MAG: hypothetical protein EOO01_06255 [Chitinophagaceae bacterium]
MRAGKIIFLVLAILCILFQVFGYLGSGFFIIPQGMDNMESSEKIGYTIGYNIMLIIGIIFLLVSQSFKKKIKKQKDKEMVDSLFADQDDIIK